MKYISATLLLIFFIASCSSENSNSGLTTLDLLKYGIPLKIMAPDSAEVQTMDLIVQKDVSIKGGDNYYVQIFVSDATTTNVEQLKENLKNEVKKSHYFSEIVRENENGFLFENKIDSTQSSFDFRYVKIQGDSEYQFQTGLIGTFTLDQVELMYKAVSE